MKIKHNWISNAKINSDEYISMYKESIDNGDNFGVSKLIELIGSKNLQKLKMLNILKKRWTLNGLKMEV